MWNNLKNPFLPYLPRTNFENPSPNLPNPDEDLKMIGKEEFYINQGNDGNMNHQLQTNFLTETKKPNFFDHFDYNRINDRSLSTNEKLPNLLENYKLNNSLFEFPIIKKKVNFKKKEPMKATKDKTVEKVYPFIIHNIENILMQRTKNPEFKSEEIIDCDLFFNSGNQNILFGHKRTKTFYKINKNLKV